MGKARDKVFTGLDSFYNNAANRARDLHIRVLPYPEPLHVVGVHMHNRAGVEIFLGCLACFHANALLDRPARDHIEGNFLLCHSISSRFRSGLDRDIC